jgi:ankyrin repeat protein
MTSATLVFALLLTLSSSQLDGLLLKAIEESDAASVAVLLGTGADPNAENTILQSPDNPERYTALMLAVQQRNVEIARALIEKGADLEFKGAGLVGETPLIMAADNGDLKMTRLLLNRGAKVDAKNDLNSTALMYAISGSYNDIARMLIRAGANVRDKQGVFDRNPLLCALAYGNTEIVSDLIAAGADVNEQGGELSTESPLMSAAARGFMDTVELLLNAGADVNAVSESNGKTALQLAIEQGKTDVAELLKQHGAR